MDRRFMFIKLTGSLQMDRRFMFMKKFCPKGQSKPNLMWIVVRIGE